MLIDCETCRAPADACGDCVMTVLLQIEPSAGRSVEFDAAERGALDLLAGAGLVPPLRLVVGVDAGHDTQEELGRNGAEQDEMPDEFVDVPDSAPGIRGIA